MKKLMKLIPAIIAIFIFLNICVFAETIHEDKKTEIISSGVIHDTITRFTDIGWFNIHVIKVDLQNPYIKMELLTSPDGMGTLANVETMAKKGNAVAAINADFFDKIGGYKSGYALGFAKSEGEVVSTTYYKNAVENKLATFSLDVLKKTMFSYVKNVLTLSNQNGVKLVLSDMNKYSATYQTPVLYNKYWGKASVGSTEKYPQMVEMVVQDNVVSEIRQGQGSAKIPENGYVISGRLEGAQKIIDNFKTQDTVSLDVYTNPDMSNQIFAISGGTILLQNGQMASFTHNLRGFQPRTGLGVSEDGRYLFMVTLDGRQSISRGMTQEEFALLLKEVGAYNAINFDGGGSTQLATRQVGTDNIVTSNSPSELPLRKVVNAIGVVNNSPKGQLSGLVIDTVDTNIFVNTKREFTVKGYDENYNPIEIDSSSVTWSISGVKGRFENNIFTALSSGEGVVKAKIGNIIKTISISVLTSPVEMDLYPGNITVQLPSDVFFTVRGKNKSGYYSVIDNSSINWNFTSNIGYFDKNIFKVKKVGSAIVTASLGSIRAYSGISVKTDEQTLVSNFDSVKPTFKSYPDTVIGAVYNDLEVKHSGVGSIKLAYDFSQINDTKAAYIVFPNDSIKIPETADQVGIWVYNSSPKLENLKAQIIDAGGNTFLVDITNDLSFTGWKLFKVSIDAEVLMPAQIGRIYVVQTDSNVMSKGDLYFDEITIFSKKAKPISASMIPKNTLYKDPFNKNISVKSGAKSFKFAVFGSFEPAKKFLTKKNLISLSNKLSQTGEVVAFVGAANQNTTNKIKKQVIIKSNNSVVIYKNTTFLTLDDQRNTLVKGDASQWKWLKYQLQIIKTENVVILMNKPTTYFSNINESELLRNTFTEFKKKTNKNIFVITGGEQYKAFLEKGVRYIRIPFNKEDIKQANYLSVYVKGNEIYYFYKKFY